ncbi:MAG: DUF6134 family protein, partial [Pseudomonadota bacterium]
MRNQLLGLVAGMLVAHAGLAAPAAAEALLEPGDAAWSPSPGDVISFDVLRKGNPFGSHTVRFDEGEAGALNVAVNVDLRAGLGPITVFRYRLDANEVWRDGKLVSLEGRVNDDGNREAVTVRTGGAGLTVEGDGYSGEIPLGTLPASHWNVAQVSATQLLSTENGELLDVDVVSLGRETITAGGVEVEANAFLMKSDIDVSLWYDDEGRWLKLSFE